MAGMVDKLLPSAGTLILVEEATRASSGDSGAITGLDAVTPLKAQLHVTEVSGMTVRVNPETKKEEEVGPPILIVVVEETLDGTNWKEIGDRGRFPLIGAVGSHTISLGDPLADTIRFTWTIRGMRVMNV